MADYPAQLVRAHRLSDGRMVTLRPIRADDAERVRAFLKGLSEESRYMRFQKWVEAPSDKLVHFLTDVDYDRHMALVCTVRQGEDELIIGEARYVSDVSGRTCELGVVVADAWRKSGAAGLLMESLIHAARERGLARMEGLVLSANADMLRFVRALGFKTETAPQDPTIVLISRNLKEDAAPPER